MGGKTGGAEKAYIIFSPSPKCGMLLLRFSPRTERTFLFNWQLYFNRRDRPAVGLPGKREGGRGKKRPGWKSIASLLSCLFSPRDSGDRPTGGLGSPSPSLFPLCMYLSGRISDEEKGRKWRERGAAEKVALTFSNVLSLHFGLNSFYIC